jgi:hypothetical protein
MEWRRTRLGKRLQIENRRASKFRAVIDDAAAAEIAPADDFAFLLHSRRAADRAGDRVIGLLDPYFLALIVARIVSLSHGLLWSRTR